MIELLSPQKPPKPANVRMVKLGISLRVAPKHQSAAEIKERKRLYAIKWRAANKK